MSRFAGKLAAISGVFLSSRVVADQLPLQNHHPSLPATHRIQQTDLLLVLHSVRQSTPQAKPVPKRTEGCQAARYFAHLIDSTRKLYQLFTEMQKIKSHASARMN